MDKYSITIDTYNKSAVSFQDKFMNMDLYNATYDKFCQKVEKKHASILEIACGPGNITKYIAAKRPDFSIFGIDLADKMIELARVNVPSARFEVMDCRDILKINNTFDAIMCGFCLPYLTKEEATKLISDAFQLLNAGGVLYISAMEGDYSKSGYETTSFSNGNQVYVHYHQADFLKEKFKEAGFVDVELITQQYPEPDGSFTTDMIFFAQKP
ncbi:MAG TPA: class I SAM-dependent methyltransferase [Bacteroidales bacterium]|nr:class I SAM-dependent methyltransferase [Bacteroidales bacterium]